MKSFFKFRNVVSLVLAIGVAGFSSAAAGPFQRASGKYRGDLKGKAKVGGFVLFRLSKTPATVKLPSGKGRLNIRFKYLGQNANASGKIDTARVRQGGKKVILKGDASIPGSKTFGLGTIKGPFTARVTRGPGNSLILKGNTRLSGSGFSVTGNFIGNQ